MIIGDLVFIYSHKSYGIIISINKERAPPSLQLVTIYNIFSEGKLIRARKFQIAKINTHTNEVKK